jgi:mono/diheme cytochrome c family protein
MGRIIALGSVFFLASMMMVSSAFADAKKGEELFKNKGVSKCQICHAIGKKLVGPDLAGVSKRHTKVWIVKWITDVQGTWTSSDPETLALKKSVKKENAPKPAHAPPPLSAEQAGDIADFLMTQ